MAVDTNIPETMLTANREAMELYQNADTRWFDFLSDTVTVYTIAGNEPFLGREEYQAHFEPILTRNHRTVTLDSLDGKMLADRVLLLQSLTIQEDGTDTAIPVRQSVVWISTENGWKIDHLHTALAGSPAGGPKMGITVLNERIATVAGVVGVAQ